MMYVGEVQHCEVSSKITFFTRDLAMYMQQILCCMSQTLIRIEN